MIKYVVANKELERIQGQDINIVAFRQFLNTLPYNFSKAQRSLSTKWYVTVTLKD